MAKQNQSDWSHHKKQLHEYMGSGNFGLATTPYTFMAWILLDEGKTESALMHASVAAYIDANGHCCQDFATQRIGNYDPEDIWEPDGALNPNNLFPLAKTAKALELSEKQVGALFENGCMKLFPDTFGAPLSYAEAWSLVLDSAEWKTAWSRR